MSDIADRHDEPAPGWLVCQVTPDEAAGPGWRKSSASSTSGCLEARSLHDGHVALRETEHPGPVLRVPPESWAAFLEGVRKGEFDDLGLLPEVGVREA
jgi:hypothetical protein